MIKSSKVKQMTQWYYKFRAIIVNSDIERQLTKIVGTCI
ncbi:MAG: hypothetical protein RLZZ293_1364 [Pseudomonadota bacterium]|jgi:hypothetical protein